MIKAAEDNKMDTLNHKGISVCRVTKLSKNAATIKIGIRPITIFNPSLAPFKTEAILV